MIRCDPNNRIGMKGNIIHKKKYISFSFYLFLYIEILKDPVMQYKVEKKEFGYNGVFNIDSS